MTTADMLPAAYHEAGHAVVSHKTGCVIKSIEIHFDESRKRWAGSFIDELPNSNDPIRRIFHFPKGAKVAVAGMLAQAKCEAIKEWNTTVIFSQNNDLSEWFHFFRDKTRTDDNPGSLTITFCTQIDRQEFTQTISGRLFGGADHSLFNRCFDQLRDVSSDNLIREVVSFLDDPDTWGTVGCLAECLCECGVGGVRRLDQEAILNILE